MNSDEDFFEVMSVGEMRRKYYGDNPPIPRIVIDPSRVPEGLRDLIPLAEKWGIGDDILRLDALDKASPQELDELRTAVEQHQEALEVWLTKKEVIDELSKEFVAFVNLQMAADGC